MRISIRSDLVRLSQASGIPIDLSEMDHKTISRDSLLMPLSFILGWNGLHPDEFLAISPLGVFKGNSSTTRQKDFFPSVMCRPLFGYDFEEIVAPRASLSSNTPLIIALQNMLKGRGKPSGHIFVIQAPFQRCGDDLLLTIINEYSRNQYYDDVYVLALEMINENDLGTWRKYLGETEILITSDFLNELKALNNLFCNYPFNYLLQYGDGTFIDGYVIYRNCENIR